MFDNILVPVDLDHPRVNDKAMKSARQIALDYDAVLHVLNVVAPLDSFASTFFPKDFSKRLTEAARARLHDYTGQAGLEGLQVHHIVAHGAIYDQIRSMAETVNADLIVMASHRPELGDYLLGPNAARVVRHATCSVMVVRE